MPSVHAEDTQRANQLMVLGLLLRYPTVMEPIRNQLQALMGPEPPQEEP